MITTNKPYSKPTKLVKLRKEVVAKLSNLRHDLGQKIKEIKSLSGDFKNSVDKEMEHTRRTVGALEVAESRYDSNPAAITGKSDPYVLRLGWNDKLRNS